MTVASPDFGHLEPMLNAARRELQPPASPSDPRWWSPTPATGTSEQMESIVADGIQVLIPPDSSRAQGHPAGLGRRPLRLHAPRARDRPRQRLYRQRQQLIEPVFAHTKHNRGIDRFHRRGRAAVRTEWRLITATHNLLKLHRHHMAVA